MSSATTSANGGHTDGLQRRVAELEAQIRNQKEYDSVLSRREELYRTVLESLAEGLLITNHESQIIYANSRLADITGYTKDELIGTVSYKLLLPAEEWPVMERRLRERLSGKSEMYEHEIFRKDGSRQWVQVKATPYRNSAGEIVGTIGALSCIDRQKTLEWENEYLHDEIRREWNPCHIVGPSFALRKVHEQIATVAATQANVLILGESGTGKELAARAIHELSPRKNKPLVRVNCASVPKDLFESEFFGHVRGAFTGAIRDRVGRFELADGGTLFLDEVGEIPLDLQSKLLRVLQEGQFERLGEDRTRTVNVRIIAATNRDLQSEAEVGRFRLDLYYRLSVFPIEIPPLRERRDDIVPIAEHFVTQTSKRLGVPRPKLMRGHLQELMDYDWPGNVRELQNVVERALILAGASGALHFDLGTAKRGKSSSSEQHRPAEHAPAASPSLVDLKLKEREIITETLKQTNWKIYGSDGAAAKLGLPPTTLASKMKKLGLRRSK